MKIDGLKLLYVCNDFPYPPMHGGLVDMWNRVQALHQLGVQLDVIATVKEEPGAEALKTVKDQVRTLHLVKRKSLFSGLFHWKPVQVKIRSGLNSLHIGQDYDFLLMQSEFVTEILRNPTIRWRKSIIRVDNDEYVYQMRTAKEERSLARKLYYFQEAFRIKSHTTKSFREADMLWFVSHEDLTSFRNASGDNNYSRSLFMPTAVDLSKMSRPNLSGKNVLFVGSLWNPLNKAAVEWYIANVHPGLADVAGYSLTIAGSTRGKDCDWLRTITSQFSNINIALDVDDLTSLYNDSALFVNPMQSGAGVKLKTVEAGVRGLPILSSSVGAEGTGLVPNVHFIQANNSEEFGAGVRRLLDDKILAAEMVGRCQQFLVENYDQARVLHNALGMV
jgi:polysaccharide biosynthesis protein PslH